MCQEAWSFEPAGLTAPGENGLVGNSEVTSVRSLEVEQHVAVFQTGLSAM